jgi:hypothetical protein
MLKQKKGLFLNFHIMNVVFLKIIYENIGVEKN